MCRLPRLLCINLGISSTSKLPSILPKFDFDEDAIFVKIGAMLIK
jgi:hypothetical protein